MDTRDTPPYSAPTTPEQSKTANFVAQSTASTPESISSATLNTTPHIPKNLTQDMVEADPRLKRLQQDLLVLTSFNDNSTIHWRPSWFQQEPFSSRVWTLHNPPHVVTEELPRRPATRQVMTRRMRRPGDRPPLYMRSQVQWERYCDMYGVPHDFLCEDQIRLLRLGLPRSRDGRLCEPLSYPLYPEPQPLNQGDYVLDVRNYGGLPPKFRSVDPEFGEYGECVVVLSDGSLRVEQRAGRCVARDQGAGRRWSYLPWTEAQEVSCRPMTLKLRLWNSVKVE
ncbi:hypothetical protein BU26DRAFT_537225 [Trematosphaeria pertusa]|uniref:Uncharacterized protein n=1 Tax=Trematosphaeria pertusa TaxID=390896 RepID=A0A6A6IYZ6_9PLEO|nr:uncharacterized protein BU26DRAFT_537225 [Trematosphaeria pertusa]KAF2254403.1 hypothetical protein BU26DRAFT_537225 [Trematosphaeria pertusa]